MAFPISYTRGFCIGLQTSRSLITHTGLTLFFFFFFLPPQESFSSTLSLPPSVSMCSSTHAHRRSRLNSRHFCRRPPLTTTSSTLAKWSTLLAAGFYRMTSSPSRSWQLSAVSQKLKWRCAPCLKRGPCPSTRWRALIGSTRI